ncbi:GIY-YIG nuclease family protein [bacterium]|nr:MAG: GIY-YIG nuclease family protein [bacterium]
MREYFVYIMTNRSKTLYTGVTGDLFHRVDQHKRGTIEGFTSRYHITQLVYYESYTSIYDAISREKQIKGWLRIKKIALIEAVNPAWEDLAKDWYE